MSSLTVESQNEATKCNVAQAFCAEFCSPGVRPKCIFCCSVYTRSVLNHFRGDWGVDGFSGETDIHGSPVQKIQDVEKNALPLIAGGGRSQSVNKELNAQGFQNLDYLSFLKYAAITPLTPVALNENFADNFREYEANYNRFTGATTRNPSTKP